MRGPERGPCRSPPLAGDRLRWFWFGRDHAPRLAANGNGIERGRAHVVDAAIATARAPRLATAPTVKDEDVTRVVPDIPREESVEVALDLLGVGMPRPSEALADSRDVGVYDHPLGTSPRHAQHYVRSLAANARKFDELVERARDISAVIGDDGACQTDQRLRFGPKETKTGDEWFDVLWPSASEGRRGRKTGEQGRRRLVHGDVGRLCAEDHGHQQFERRAVIELAMGRWVLGRQASQRLRRPKGSLAKSVATFFCGYELCS